MLFYLVPPSSVRQLIYGWRVVPRTFRKSCRLGARAPSPLSTDIPVTGGHRAAYIRQRAGRDGFFIPYDIRRRQAQHNHGSNVVVRNAHQVFQVLLPDFRPVYGAHEGAADADMLGGVLDRHTEED